MSYTENISYTSEYARTHAHVHAHTHTHTHPHTHAHTHTYTRTHTKNLGIIQHDKKKDILHIFVNTKTNDGQCHLIILV